MSSAIGITTSAAASQLLAAADERIDDAPLERRELPQSPFPRSLSPVRL
jgi:hypothetical protein